LEANIYGFIETAALQQAAYATANSSLRSLPLQWKLTKDLPAKQHLSIIFLKQ